MLAVGFQAAGNFRRKQSVAPSGKLTDSVPTFLAGWMVTSEPLGSTEAVNEAALKALNFDDYMFRRYRRGSVSFTVYAAYWAPGRMPTRLVASHTPDRCWTENGMRCIDLRFKQTYEIKGRRLLPAEYRVFTGPSGIRVPEADRTKKVHDRHNLTSDLRPLPSDSRSLTSAAEGKAYVVYWHLVEGKLYDYGERFNAVPHPWLWWKDVVAQAAYGSREQLFVRVASNTPFETLWREPGFQEVMAAVAELGMYETAR